MTAEPAITSHQVERAKGGKFAPGKSGNPTGRPKDVAEVVALARTYTAEAVSGLAAIARDKKAPAAARVTAWTGLLDRGWGKPPQAHEHGGPGGAPIQVVIKGDDAAL